MKIDFLICGSPNDAFCSQIAFFRLCLDALGGRYRQARLVAVFGHEDCVALPTRWEPYFANIDTVWVTGDHYDPETYNSQHYARFEHVRHAADIAIMCDADVALMSPFCDYLDALQLNPALSGTIAHFPPWHDPELVQPIDWDILSESVINTKLEKPYKYTLMEPEQSPDTPFYINYGVLMGTPDLFKRLHTRESQLREQVISKTSHWWCAQLSLTLTCAEQGLPVRALPMRYNYPNDVIADRLYPVELDNTVFMHYLRTDQFDRHKIFTSQNEFNHFINLTLTGSNRTMQQHVIMITQGVYPF